MKIMPVVTYSQNINRNFKAASTNNNTQPSNETTNKGCIGNFPYWALVAYAFATSDPSLKLLDKAIGLEDKNVLVDTSLKEYQENFNKCLDLSKNFLKVNGISVAHHPLRTLVEIDDASFTTGQDGSSSLVTFKTDDNLISFTAKADKKDNTKMTGEFAIVDLEGKTDLKKYSYKAHFSKDNSTTVKVECQRTDTDGVTKPVSVLLKRESDGSLFVIKNGKKVKINSKNVEEHKKFTANLEEAAELERNKPDHRLLYIILMLMTVDRMVVNNFKTKQ